MKKSLLILILCLFAGINSVQAQVVTYISNIVLCPDIIEPTGTIFIGYKAQEILEAADPLTHIVTFFGSLEDAQNNTNALPNQEYASLSISTVFARLDNTTDSSVSYYAFQIIIFAPDNLTATLLFCDPSELPVYNLMDANAQFNTASVPNNEFTYYLTFEDAQNYTNPLPNPFYYPQNNPGIDVVYARYVSIMGCQSIGTIELQTNTCTTSCTAPTNLTATNVTDTSFELSWVPTANPVSFSYVSIVPQGSPPSENNNLLSGNIYSIILTGLTPNTCYSVYVRSICGSTISNEWSAPFDICMPDCTNSGQCAQAFLANAFLDSNTNGIKDDGEVNFPYGTFEYQINNSGTNLYGTSSNGSYYIFDGNASNSYALGFVVNSELASYYSCTTSYNNITLPTGSGTNYLYFPVVNTQPYIDASVSITPIGQPRPGFTYINYIRYKNNSLQTIANGTITFAKDAAITIIDNSQAGTTPTADGFSFNFTNLAPFETRAFIVTFQVPTIPTVSLWQLITNTATVTVDNDTNVANNTATITQAIVGSYDPNDITESHGEKIVFEDFTADDYLIYTIRFENTGTANAEFIRIEDALDSQLDENTFELISSSHEVNVRRDGTALTFHFYGIDLPPSTININDGHGYVQFKIKPKTGYAIGDIIPNTASIFFDYNPPIVTNTFETEFVENLSTSTFTQANVVIYPNPATNYVQVALNNSAENIQSITLMNVLGKTILEQQNIANNQTIINTSSLAKGMYLIKITSETKVSLIKKLIIQ